MIKKLVKKVLYDIFGYRILSKDILGVDIITDISKILGSENEIVIFDIGANKGATSLELAEAFPKATIHAFEPDFDTFRKLQADLRSHKNILTHNFGFGKLRERKELFINKGSGGNSFLKLSPNIQSFASGDWTENIGRVTAEVRTVNDFCRDQKIPHIDIVKIDTQGFEMPILEGGDQIINGRHTRIVYIEVLFVDLYSGQSYFHDMYSLLCSRGYSLVGLYNCFRKPDSPHYMLWCDALFVSTNLV